MPNFIYRGIDGFKKSIDTASLAPEFSGAPPPNNPDALNDELSTVGPLDPAQWEVSGAVADLAVDPPVVTQSDLGLDIDWTPAVANTSVIMRRGDAPVSDFGVYAHIAINRPEQQANVNFIGVFAGTMTGTNVDNAFFAGGQSGGAGPRYGGKTFTSASQISGTFENTVQASAMWVRLRYIAATRQGIYGISGDGRAWNEVRTDTIPAAANSVGIALIASQVVGAPRIRGSIRSFRVVPGTVDPAAPVPSSVFE